MEPSFIYDGGTMDIVLLFLCRTVPAREKQTLPCLGSHRTVAVETVLGIAQSIGLLENSDPQFIIGGSMTNPGAYAGYLGVTAPLILSLLVSYKKNKRFENICYILGGLFILVCYLLILSRSREHGSHVAQAVFVYFAIGMPISTRYQLLE